VRRAQVRLLDDSDLQPKRDHQQHEADDGDDVRHHQDQAEAGGGHRSEDGGAHQRERPGRDEVVVSSASTPMRQLVPIAVSVANVTRSSSLLSSSEGKWSRER
jgi:hypothetical protein